MDIQQIPFQASPELEKELKYFAETNDGLKIYSEIRNREDIVSWIETNPDYVDLKTFGPWFPPGKLLDVGVGWGMTSAYLAVRGYAVTCLDPSLESCRQMEFFFRRLNLPIIIVCGIAEALDQLQGNFDSVAFWSSLHHCDHPLLALKNAHNILRPGGWVVLYEPVLRFYRTKGWFYQMMQDDPKKVGHYGGNEHIYRYHEYLQFLTQAGFKNVFSRPSLRYVLGPKRAPWDDKFRWPIKKLYYWATRKIASEATGISRFLIRLSLLTPFIAGQKVKSNSFSSYPN